MQPLTSVASRIPRFARRFSRTIMRCYGKASARHCKDSGVADIEGKLCPTARGRLVRLCRSLKTACSNLKDWGLLVSLEEPRMRDSESYKGLRSPSAIIRTDLHFRSLSRDTNWQHYFCAPLCSAPRYQSPLCYGPPPATAAARPPGVNDL